MDLAPSSGRSALLTLHKSWQVGALTGGSRLSHGIIFTCSDRESTRLDGRHLLLLDGVDKLLHRLFDKVEFSHLAAFVLLDPLLNSK